MTQNQTETVKGLEKKKEKKNVYVCWISASVKMVVTEHSWWGVKKLHWNKYKNGCYWIFIYWLLQYCDPQFRLFDP